LVQTGERRKREELGNHVRKSKGHDKGFFRGTKGGGRIHQRGTPHLIAKQRKILENTTWDVKFKD